MKTSVIVQARMGSTRFPGKILKEVDGQPLLAHLFKRLSLCKEVDSLILATTTNSEDDLLEEFASKFNVNVFRGSVDDVLDRYFNAAQKFGTDVIVRVTSDCPLIDPAIIDEAIVHFNNNDLDFYSNSEPLPSKWPDGMDLSIFTLKALKKVKALAQKPSDKEHVTFFFWQNPELFKCSKWEASKDFSKFRLTIDYIEDLTIIENVILNFANSNVEEKKWPNTSMDQIVDYLSNNPSIANVNSMYIRGMGWEKSFEKDRESGFS